jgi:hypothetical protein
MECAAAEWCSILRFASPIAVSTYLSASRIRRTSAPSDVVPTSTLALRDAYQLSVRHVAYRKTSHATCNMLIVVF